MPEPHILIIGAGVTGLAIAQGLRKANVPFTVFEAEDQSTFQQRDWTMALSWGLPMLQSLLPGSLSTKLEERTVVRRGLDYSVHPNNIIPIFDGVDGKLVRKVPTGGIRVSRRKLRDLCGENIEIKYGSTLQDVSYNDDSTVEALFANGVRALGTLVVGADGPQSTVRRVMFGDAARSPPVDRVYMTSTVCYNDAQRARLAQSANPVNSVAVSPNITVFLSVQDAVEVSDPATWKFQIAVMWNKKRQDPPLNSDEEVHAEVTRRAAELCEPFQSVILAIPKDVKFISNENRPWSPPNSSWETQQGRITLAGDAAHSMPPHRGQGLNHAVNDAKNLVDAILEVHVGNEKEAIQAYGMEVASRGAKEVLLSTQTAKLMMDHARFKESALMSKGFQKN